MPQPGLLKTLVETGEVQPAPEGVEANVDENWSPDWKAYGTVDDVFYAAPMLANVKGYVWYSPASFEEWGVEVPTTWDELLELTATIQEKTGAAAVVRGLLVRGGVRLAGHGLDRGPRPAPVRSRGLRPVGRQRGEVHRS